MKSGITYIIPIVLCFVLFIVGLMVYNDYGLPNDNSISRNNGVYAYRFLLGDRSIETYSDKYYSTGLELPLVLLEVAFHVTSIQDVFYLRYLALYSVFVISLIAFYIVSTILTKRWWLGVVGVLSIWLYPRIFVDAFTNTKDVGLLCMVIFSIATVIVFSRKKNMLWAGIHGLIVGLTIAVRPVGILFIPLFFLHSLPLIVYTPRKYIKMIRIGIIYVIGLCIGTLMFWPYLWPDPIHRFITALTLFSRYPFPGSVLYLGQYIKAGATPWHYLPVWMAVTIPPVVLGFLLIGIVNISKDLFNTLRNRKIHYNAGDMATVLYWAYVPILSIILFRSVVYDGWRHVYFVYPALVMICLYGIDWMWRQQRYRTLFRTLTIILLLLQSGSLVWWSIRTHPNEHVYFNMFAGGMKRAKEQFDVDYWALSYRSCIEKILARDRRPKITFSFWYSKLATTYILPFNDQQRIEESDDPLKANYFISNYRQHKEEYPVQTPPICTVEIDGTRITVAYRIKP